VPHKRVNGERGTAREHHQGKRLPGKPACPCVRGEPAEEVAEREAAEANDYHGGPRVQPRSEARRQSVCARYFEDHRRRASDTGCENYNKAWQVSGIPTIVLLHGKTSDMALKIIPQVSSSHQLIRIHTRYVRHKVSCIEKDWNRRTIIKLGKGKALSRPSWDEYFMRIAHEVAKRSTCLRRKVGAVLVHEKRILTTGYNGAPSGLKHCEEVGCLRERLNVPSGHRHELCRGLHAEMNALLQAAIHGISVSGAALYCTDSPCSLCAKMLINVGVESIYIDGEYPDELAAEFLKDAGVTIYRLNEKKSSS
jgi:dCMP deaminase